MSDDFHKTNQAENSAYNRESFVLVVDDDNTLLKFFKIHLNKFFSRVIVVKNAKEAIDMLREKEIDLVLSDIRMPRMDGLQLMKRIRRHDPTIPVLLVSGALLSEIQEQLADGESDGYLRKPFNVDDLHDFINRGLLMREKYKLISEKMIDKKLFRRLLKGKIKTEKVIIDMKDRRFVDALLADLKLEMPAKAG
jgi:DNA-binding NtrC family response regulator